MLESAAASLETSACWDDGIGSCKFGGVSVLGCRYRLLQVGGRQRVEMLESAAALSCPVVLVSLTTMKRVVSKRTRGNPRAAFGIKRKRLVMDFCSLVLKRLVNKEETGTGTLLHDLGHLRLCPSGAVTKDQQIGLHQFWLDYGVDCYGKALVGVLWPKMVTDSFRL